MTPAGLDQNSQRLAALLLAEWPDWESFAKNENGFLSVTIPNPPGSDLRGPLELWMEEGHASVGLDWYHAHFDWPSYPDNYAPELTDPIALLRLLVEERRAIITFFKGDKWYGSTTIPSDEIACGDLSEASVLGAWVSNPGIERGAADRVRVRSWRGTFDLDRRIAS